MDGPCESIVDELNLRLAKYITVQKAAETEGNASKVRRYQRIVAQYVSAIKSVKNGNLSVVSELPNPPGFPPIHSESSSTTAVIPNVEDSPLSERSREPTPISEVQPQPTVVIDKSPDTPTNILNELTQRLEKYKSVLKSAEDEDSGPKIRRYKRIIGQYNDALSKLKSGKEVDLGELPNPPGFMPLVPASSPMPSPESSPLPTRSLQPSPLPVRQPSPTPPKRTLDPPQLRSAPPPPSRVVTRADKNTALLKERQKEYRDAAITAKKAGQIAEAKEFLKISKGFDRLINASESGLPIDLTSIPVSLQMSSEVDNFHMVTDEDFSGSSSSDVFQMLKQELAEQIKSCEQRRNMFKETGDVANANRFNQWALTFKKDLNKIQIFQTSSQPVPKFHYEQKSFPVVHCFSDIPPGVVELTIVQAVSLPKVVDSYVGYEFPYPSESPPSGYTSVFKNSVSPAYNATLTFPIDRDAKPCQRMFKRHGIKLEVWSKGGLFHRDTSLGTVVVKLLPLSTDIMIHDAYDLMNGRRPAGGKLEVKVRVREPILTKKIETISEKWLILDL